MQTNTIDNQKKLLMSFMQIGWIMAILPLVMVGVLGVAAYFSSREDTTTQNSEKQLKNHHETNNHIHTDVDCYISTLIPQDYVEDIFLRLDIYNDISNAKNDYDINHIVSKLEDVYGPIPDYLKNLFSLTRVKIEGNRPNRHN